MTALLIAIVFFVGCLSNVCASDKIDELKAVIQTTLAPNNNIEIKYKRIVTSPPDTGDFAEDHQKKIAKLDKILNSLETNMPLDDSDKEYANLSKEELIKYEEQFQKLLNGITYETYQTYAMSGSKMRSDSAILNISNNKKSIVSFIFNGFKAYEVHHGEKTVTIYDALMKRVLNPMNVGLFGLNLNQFVDKGFYISDYDKANRTLKLKSDVFLSPDATYEFKLLEGHPAYWTECKIVNDSTGYAGSRMICQDFVDVDGLLIPGFVQRQAYWRNINEWREHYEKFLFDSAKVKDAAFDKDYFALPDPAEYEYIER